MKDIIVVKLGGSVITDKRKGKGVFRKSNTKRLIGELKKAQDTLNCSLVVVHGAGSFGHPIAKKYKLSEGLVNEKSMVGLSKCRESMSRLKSAVLLTFLSQGLSADIVDTSSVSQTISGKIKKFDLVKIRGLLGIGVVPILSGDVVLDSKKGCSILSGDVIVPYLTKKLGAKRVIYVSDVDGVFDKNPQKFSDAKLIPKIDGKNVKKVLANLDSSGRDDVTGEMKGKITVMFQSLRGVKACIVNGFKSGRVLDAICGNIAGTSFSF